MAQVKSEYVKLDDDEDGFIYVGTCNFADVNALSAFNIVKTLDYQPDSASLSILQQQLNEYKIICFIGTWCEDSHDQIPVLYKVLKDAQYPINSVQFYALDRDKKSPNHDEDKYQIELLPTIILIKDGKEKGRIVETPKRSIEVDLAEIIDAK